MSLLSTTPKLETYNLSRMPLSALLTDYYISGSDPFTCCQKRLVWWVPPFTFTPRRFPAESDDPALNPPARFVAVRIERSKVGLCIISDGKVNELKNEVVCRIIMMIQVLL